MANEGIAEILSKLDDNSLYALSSTVTQGCLKDKISSRTSAIQAIINHSPDVNSILKRKSITRDILFSYLHENNIAVHAPFTKTDLVQKIVDHWNSASLATPQPTANPSVDRLAAEFTQWFYTILNTTPIDSEHFYPDSSMKICVNSETGTINVIEAYSNVDCAQQISQVKNEYNLFFNPNLTNDGIRGKVDNHGLVLVLVCGTLHANTVCVGVFEQLFLLARDPFSGNNWKIRMSELRMNQCAVQTPPNIEHSDLYSINYK